MKAKVISRFRDKHTSEIHEAGDIIEVNQERADEILSKGKFIEIIEEEPEKKPAKQKKKAKKEEE